MTEWLHLLVSVIVISASGALAPGPLFVATVSEGVRKGPRAGLLSATGHMIVEFPLVLLLAGGFALIVSGDVSYQVFVGVAGSLALVIFGYMQIRGAFRGGGTAATAGSQSRMGGPLLVGIIFTGLNPYFIAWWLTVGAKLVLDSFRLAAWVGILAMYVSHIWIDYAWLYAAAFLSHRGAKLVQYRGLRLVNIALGILLILLAAMMLSDVMPKIFG
jgi:threonine/homoserine/homoserine lactone efflux protein